MSSIEIMDSSDSEEDCYGNIAQKLQRMKNNYNADKIESTNLLDDSVEVEVTEIIKNTESTSKAGPKTQSANDSICIVPETSLASFLNSRAEKETPTKRLTRSSAKRASSEVSMTETTLPKRTRGRKKTADNSESSNSILTGNTNTEIQVNSRSRARPRGRGRNRRNTRISNSPQASYPTYSVGNTYEYPDQCEDQLLFSNKSDKTVTIEDTEFLEENEELSVKVYWQSSEIYKFPIRRYQKIKQIFDHFAELANVSHDKLLFMFKDRILKPEDTPDEIDYNIVKFIDGGIVNQSVSKLVKEDMNTVKDGIKIKFQCQMVKKPYETVIKLDDALSISMLKCAEHLETALDKLKFYFDGDLISGKSTARELELEGGECIDVRIIINK